MLKSYAVSHVVAKGSNDTYFARIVSACWEPFETLLQTTREDALREVNEREELQLFLDDPSVAVLCVHAAETGGLQLSNRLSISEEQKGQRRTTSRQF